MFLHSSVKRFQLSYVFVATVILFVVLIKFLAVEENSACLY